MTTIIARRDRSVTLTDDELRVLLFGARDGLAPMLTDADAQIATAARGAQRAVDAIFGWEGVE